MIIYTENNVKQIAMRSDHPNDDWFGCAEYIIDDNNPDNKELISKIFEYTPYFDYVLDDNGNLIDVIKTQDKPEPELDPSLNINDNSMMMNLYNENKILSAKVQALTESNQFLEDCIVELAETVYA